MSVPPPREVLSEHFQQLMSGRRLVSAVFTTFRFDPGFFEQEVLPVFLDVPLSHAVGIRLVQLEEALLAFPGDIAVYYDASGLWDGGAGSARLDVRRIKLRHRTGIFHPKNVFLLVESEEPDADGERDRWLLAACMSANMTRSGWWENVEVCHVEEIADGAKTKVKEDLLAYLKQIRRLSPPHTDHSALYDIARFVRGTRQIVRRSAARRLFTHFYSGSEPLLDFLDETAGKYLRGAYLEVISPYMDSAARSKPLEDLIERFSPRQVRVFLPREPDGTAACTKAIYEWADSLGNVKWGTFPREVTRLGKASDSGDRRVHAKVYRFFGLKPKWEIQFVGSANLTNAAHLAGGNVETGYLVEIDPPKRHGFWLEADENVPPQFERRTEDEASELSAGIHLEVRYNWSNGEAHVFWDDKTPSGKLEISSQGVPRFDIEAIPPGEWRPLANDVADRLREALGHTSFLTVKDPSGASAAILVQEDGMSHKPSLLLQLSVADILKYWSLLTVEQRTAFIETRATELLLTGQGADLVTTSRFKHVQDTLFDRFAGYFHAFGCLERAVDRALDEGNEREAVYRLFGKKYDSLGSLIQRVLDDGKPEDPVDRYVIGMCARQLRNKTRSDETWADFWSRHRQEAQDLQGLLKRTTELRRELLRSKPEAMEPFLEWFDHWFLKRAKPVGDAK